VGKIVYGVDFGTSNSAIAIMDGERQTVIKGSKEENKTDSSIIFFPEWETGVYYIGNEAIKRYIENEMEGRLIQSL